MQDKWQRIENYFLNGNLVNESVRDAFIDNAVYSLMAVLIMDEMSEDLDLENMEDPQDELL